jgi:hypothetical protein
VTKDGRSAKTGSHKLRPQHPDLDKATSCYGILSTPQVSNTKQESKRFALFLSAGSALSAFGSGRQPAANCEMGRMFSEGLPEADST